MPLDDTSSPQHEHNGEDEFQRMLREAVEQRNREEEPAESSFSLNSDAQLTDNYSQEEEKTRSRSISTILTYYGQSYKNKIYFQDKYRKILFWGCGAIIALFVVAEVCILIFTLKNVNKLNLSGVAAMITATAALVISILDLVRVITKYCFPENDEEYIVKIVKSIQNNDLEKFKESNRSAEARDRNHDSE